MPFVDIRLAGSATREQKAAVVAAWRLLPSPGRKPSRRHARSLVEWLGKPAAAVQIVISEISTENYAAGGQLLADRDATPQPGEDAHAADTPR